MFHFQEREVKTEGEEKMKMKRRRGNWSSKKMAKVRG
jgi:hypothetical protein